jgi:hypothetical protein
LSVNDRISKGRLVATEEDLLPFADLNCSDETIVDAAPAGGSEDAGMQDVDIDLDCT